jgi:hypothetical protein
LNKKLSFLRFMVIFMSYVHSFRVPGDLHVLEL